jgi:hypothetical protein
MGPERLTRLTVAHPSAGTVIDHLDRRGAARRSLLHCMSPELAVRPEGANHQWRKNPPRELSIDLVADERLVLVTARAGAS